MVRRAWKRITEVILQQEPVTSCHSVKSCWDKKVRRAR